jgi:hypothetical protein
MSGCALDSSDSGSCQHGNERSCSTEVEFLDWLKGV